MLGTESTGQDWLHNFPSQLTSSQFKGTLSWVNREISKWLLFSHYTILCSQQYNIFLQSVLQSVFNIDDQINLANNASCQESVDVSFRALKFDSNCSHCITATARLLFRVKFLLGFRLGFRCSPVLKLFVSFLHQRLSGFPRPVLDISERLGEILILVKLTEASFTMEKKLWSNHIFFNNDQSIL